jgi:hypothetical protein
LKTIAGVRKCSISVSDIYGREIISELEMIFSASDKTFTLDLRVTSGRNLPCQGLRKRAKPCIHEISAECSLKTRNTIIKHNRLILSHIPGHLAGTEPGPGLFYRIVSR